MKKYLKQKTRKIFRLFFVYSAITLITGALVFPFLWMVSTSFKESAEIFTEIPHWIPKRVSLVNYYKIWSDESGFPKNFRNSIIVATFTTIIAIMLSTFAAYGLARFRFRGRNFFSLGLLVTQMFPPVLLIIPIYLIMINLRLINTYPALVITYCTFAVPFSTWMLYGYFESLPAELEEAALVDGCSRTGALFRIIVPLSAPGIAAVALFSFILSWQEYMFALTLTRTAEMRTLPVGISMLVGFREVLWGQLMAGSVIVTVPVVVLFVYFQKYLIKGLTMGAVKG